MHVSCSPIARATSVAATAESTPPESAHITLSLPTARRESRRSNARRTSPSSNRRRSPGDLAQEVFENRSPVLRVHDLGMKLHAVDLLLLVAHRRDATTRSRSERAIAARQRNDRIPVRHPDSRLFRDAVEERRFSIADDQRARTVLGMIELDELGADLARQQLHSVADAEDRHAASRRFPYPSPARRRPACSPDRPRESAPPARARRELLHGVSCGTISQ